MANMRATYSDTAIDFSLNPRNMGKLESPDGFGRVTGPCGDTMEIYLKAENGSIIDARFITDGCVTSIAAGSMVTELARGKSLVEAGKISQGEVLQALEGLPEESEHCALLAADTLKEAIKNCLDSKRGRGERPSKELFV
ncbi:MAG: iron-sulfur cluster assembly scaffold protein [Dehalococcoidia bacterium]|nr:iron-sulfur cluster assembly scaffold protein [Dehalococcoidia bacterium]